MMNIKRGLIFFVLLLSLSFVFAEDVNISIQDQATICLRESRAIVEELQMANFSIARANDTLKQADNMYASQDLLQKNRGTGDFSLVLPRCSDLVKLRTEAFNSRDALTALLKFYEESFSGTNINTSSVDVILDQIREEILSERYEKVQPLVTEAYEQIITVKSEYSTLNLFYQSTSRSLQKFFIDNWKILIISLTTLLILFLIYRTSIYRTLVRKKIISLQERKESLRNLIMKTQKEYFEGGNISESTYTIRTKSFAEMIRDIDRQIPLLQEKMFLYSGGRSKEETKYAKMDEKHKKKESKKFEKHVHKHEKKLTKKVNKEIKHSWKGFKPKHKKFKKVVKKGKKE